MRRISDQPITASTFAQGVDVGAALTSTTDGVIFESAFSTSTKDRNTAALHTTVLRLNDGLPLCRIPVASARRKLYAAMYKDLYLKRELVRFLLSKSDDEMFDAIVTPDRVAKLLRP